MQSDYAVGFRRSAISFMADAGVTNSTPASAYFDPSLYIWRPRSMLLG
jgi:hypothetical protein